MTEPTRCPRCGSPSTVAGASGVCPACLLQLALDAGGDGEPDDDQDLAGPACRVLTVLSTGEERTTYLTEDVETRRLLTLDVVRLPAAERDEVVRACRDRLRSLMRWAHAGAAHVVGGQLSPKGEFCVVAHYVKGQRLDRFCEEHDLEPARRERLFERVREAVADGHRNGIVHGRLRPDLVIASGSSLDPTPVVLGYSVTPGQTPTERDDVEGLGAIARALRIAR